MNDNNKIPPYFHSTKQFVSFYISQSQPLPQVLCGYEKHNNQQKLTVFLLIVLLVFDQNILRFNASRALTLKVRSKWRGSQVEYDWLLTVDCQHFGRWSVGGRGRNIIQTQTSPDFRPQWFASL